MQISNDVARAEMLSFFKARAEDKQINSTEDYEKHLYKVIVQHLNVFSGEYLLEQELTEGKQEGFEYLTWMAAVECYEIKHDLPRRLSQLRFDLDLKVNNKHKYVNLIDLNKDIIVLKSRLPAEYKTLGSYSEYKFHLYKFINETFSGKKKLITIYVIGAT
ncbi:MULTISPECIES: hypothetical protein [unclassified Colwellia]|uniref:hypothetical protein n=2 Tax=Colwellia TaxID=28228 RepID=UPI0015F3C59D|nr:MULTISPECIES: hypothetical protein [unclassified Colwellia]MBA6356488.1 hypothetical protein [Colwellia sp. BRX8-3]MBA6367578.1 hypothetical protein [Colwellia sp. BRX8-5]MBA6375052.1 hypothetical protein [Colwellia sp. BRX8-2]